MGLKFAETTAECEGHRLLIKALFQTSIDQRSDALIVGDEGERFTYAEFGARVRRLGSALIGGGVRQGDVVAMMDWDTHRYLEAYFAVPMIGAVLQTVNVRLSPEQICYTLNATRPKLILVHRDFEPLIDLMSPGFDADYRVEVMNADDDRYEMMLGWGDPDHRFEDFDEKAVATIFHTTGTTGLPKAVSFSHRQLVLHTLAVAAHLANLPDNQSFRRDDVYMPITPMFHVHAWGMPYVATMLGVKQVYPGRYVPSKLLELKEKEGVTFSHGVPTILQMLVEGVGAGTTAPWKMVVGGSALSTALQAAAAKRGINAYAGYGMSETGPVLTIATADPGEPDTACRAGRPIPLVELSIDGEIQGEILVRAPWLTPAYQGNPEASAALWAGGWLHTQDVGERLANGDVVIRDRLKDVIKTGGEWVSSLDLEELITQHPQVDAAAVVGVSDPKWGERPVAFLICNGAQPSNEELRQHLAAFVETGEISRYAIPDRFELVADIPKTSVGKIDKVALRKML